MRQMGLEPSRCADRDRRPLGSRRRSTTPDALTLARSLAVLLALPLMHNYAEFQQHVGMLFRPDARIY
jgi:hypothetical protein